MSSLRLSSDVGGTFTDIVLQEGDSRWTAKVLTTPAAPEKGVMQGVAEILALAGRSLRDVASFVHGTTLATNAIIERRGARTALLTTEGFRDVLEIGTESRYDQYELALDRPAPLVARPLRLTVAERIDARGKVLLPLDEPALHAIAERARAERVESLAIAFLHAYANPKHEQRAGEILRAMVPGLAISLSSDVCPEIREYERISTTVANAYVQPLIDGYLGRLQQELRERGFVGTLALITSGGGLTSIETARAFPVRLVESGPAGGAVFAAEVAARLDERRVIAFDMGGTTAKVSLIRDFRTESARLFEVDRAARFLKGSGLPLRIPVIELVEIGAGGGSLAGVDHLGRIGVGPESASSVPGPASYGLGGARPAVTDADVALGLIRPDGFAGGAITLDPEKARAALREAIGAPLGLDDETAAHAVYEVVCENMASAARAHTVERGVDASDHTMIAFGGAAPLHVARVAEKIGVPRVIIPSNAGVGSAVGFLAAPVALEIVRSAYQRLDRFDPVAATAVLDEVGREIRAWVEPASQGAPTQETRIAFMRYVGQGHEIAVSLPLRALTDADGDAIRAEYEATYEAHFGRRIPNAAIEILAWSVSAATAQDRPKAIAPVTTRIPARPGGSTRIFDGRAGAWRDVHLYDRAALSPGSTLSGPALIAEAETTTFVTAAFDAWIDAAGSIVLDRKGAAA